MSDEQIIPPSTSKAGIGRLIVKLLILAALVVGGAKGYEYRKEGQPYLVGRCFTPGDGTGFAVVMTIEAEDEEGKKQEVYVGVTVVGPFQAPQLLKIRELNKAIKDALAEKKLQEVNCETGEPVQK